MNSGMRQSMVQTSARVAVPLGGRLGALAVDDALHNHSLYGFSCIITYSGFIGKASKTCLTSAGFISHIAQVPSENGGHLFPGDGIVRCRIILFLDKMI